VVPIVGVPPEHRHRNTGTHRSRTTVEAFGKGEDTILAGPAAFTPAQLCHAIAANGV
jgi:hypothetical protein